MSTHALDAAIDRELQGHALDAAIDRELQGHALDAQQLADAARHYADNLSRGARTEDSNYLASLAARVSRQAHVARRRKCRRAGRSPRR
ncbi:hypothetical protein [Kitasatospora sp. MBT66]|uniref:hypothetical protein n=1 Tax=Kitasatospora sp. MBT66 TaxID=1444769 RepID=UPI0005B91621|nr:hypothetical protein [Kitasatospora sp. MBT66]